MDAELIFIDFEEKTKVKAEKRPAEDLSKSEKIKRLAELVAAGEYKPDSEDTASAIVEALESEGLELDLDSKDQ